MILYDKAHWIFEQDVVPEYPPTPEGDPIVVIDISNRLEVQVGWDYNSSTGTFTEPIPPPPQPYTPPPITFQQVQAHFYAMQLGVDIQLSPEETGALAAFANLPPTPNMQEWRAGLNLAKGKVVTFNSHNFEVIQGHISQAGWTPDATPALFRQIQEDYAEWIQPLGAHDAYMAGDKVSFGGQIWISDIDFNVHPPGVFGWTAQ
jgi:hypothetical protein